MADDYMRQVAQAFYGMPNAPVMDAPPVQGDPAAMAAPDWNDPTKYGGGGMSAAPPPEPLVSVAPPPPPPAQSAPPSPAAPAPIRPNWSDPTTYGGAVAAPQGPLHLNVPAPTPAQEAAIKAVENIKPSAPAPKPEVDPAPIADATAAGAPGGGGPRVPGGSDVSLQLSSPGFDYRMIPGAGGPVRSVEKDMLGPKAHGLIDHGFGAESEGTATAAQLQQAQAAREAEAMQARANQLQEQQDAMERARAQRADELAKLHAEMKADADQVAAQNIDNDRLFNSKQGLNKGLAMVGIALGGFIQGMRGGPNVALDAINTQIERDIAAQKFAHEAKLKSFDAKQSAYKMALEKYGQEDVAQNMARIYMLDKYAAETAKMAATSKSSDAQAVNAKLQGEFAKSKDMLNATNLKLIQVGGGGGRRFVDPRTGLTYSEAELKKKYDAQELETVKTGLEMTKDTNKAKADGTKDVEGRFVPTGPAGGYFAPTKEEAKDQREGRQAAANILDQIAEAKKLRRELGAGDALKGALGIDSATRTKLEAIQTDIIANSNKAAKLGAMDTGTQKLLEKKVGNLSSTDPRKNPDAQLDMMEQTVKKQLERSEQGYKGYVPKEPPTVKR